MLSCSGTVIKHTMQKTLKSCILSCCFTVEKCRAVYCKLQWEAQLASIPRRVAAVEVLLVPPGTQASRYYHIRTSCKDFLEQQASRYYDISYTGLGVMGTNGVSNENNTK